MNKIFSSTLFAGKVNIVTGGGSGIGFGVAQAIVELGEFRNTVFRQLYVRSDAREQFLLFNQ